MKKQLLICATILMLAECFTLSLNAIPRKQDKRITLNVTVQEAELIMKALSELPLKESAALYFSIENQARTQLQPVQQKPKDTTLNKPKKP